MSVATFLKIEGTARGSRLYSMDTTKRTLLKSINSGAAYLIESNNIPVGTIICTMKNPNHAYLSNFVIHPKYRRRGIGKQAMQILLKKLRGVERIDLVTHPHNAKAVMLYLALGFVIESWKNNYFGDGEPRLVLVRIKKN